MSRGESLCNPGNIRISDNPWLGKITPSLDPDFEEFENDTYGIRALAKLLYGYYRFHGLSTVTGLINRWAPSSENNTSAYIADVSDRIGCGIDDSLDLSNPEVLGRLVRAIIFHENGRCIYSDDLISQAVNCALGIVPLQPTA